MARQTWKTRQAVQDDPLGFWLTQRRERASSALNLLRAAQLLDLRFVDREIANELFQAAFGFTPTPRAWDYYAALMNFRAKARIALFRREGMVMSMADLSDD